MNLNETHMTAELVDLEQTVTLSTPGDKDLPFPQMEYAQDYLDTTNWLDADLPVVTVITKRVYVRKEDADAYYQKESARAKEQEARQEKPKRSGENSK